MVFLWWVTCTVTHVVLWFPGFSIKFLFAMSEHKLLGQFSLWACIHGCSLGQQQLELHSWEEPVLGKSVQRESCAEDRGFTWSLPTSVQRFEKEKLWVHTNTACVELPKGISLAAVPLQGSATVLRALSSCRALGNGSSAEEALLLSSCCGPSAGLLSTASSCFLRLKSPQAGSCITQ